MQSFAGLILEVTDSDFCAELKDLTEPSNPLETGTISLSVIEEADRLWVQEGNTFVWNISEDDGSYVFVFNKKVWTPEMLQAVRSKAKVRCEELGLDQSGK